MFSENLLQSIEAEVPACSQILQVNLEVSYLILYTSFSLSLSLSYFCLPPLPISSLSPLSPLLSLCITVLFPSLET